MTKSLNYSMSPFYPFFLRPFSQLFKNITNKKVWAEWWPNKKWALVRANRHKNHLAHNAGPSMSYLIAGEQHQVHYVHSSLDPALWQIRASHSTISEQVSMLVKGILVEVINMSSCDQQLVCLYLLISRK